MTNRHQKVAVMHVADVMLQHPKHGCEVPAAGCNGRGGEVEHSQCHTEQRWRDNGQSQSVTARAWDTHIRLRHATPHPRLRQ